VGCAPSIRPNTPASIKTDCIVLDFGTASLMHGSLEQEVDLDGFETGDQAPTKELPRVRCGDSAGLAECPLVRHVFQPQRHDEKVRSSDFVMSEIDLLEALELLVVRSLRRRLRVAGHRLQRLGRRLLPEWPLVRRRRTGRPSGACWCRRTHGVPGAGRRLAERTRNGKTPHTRARRWLNEAPTEAQLCRICRRRCARLRIDPLSGLGAAHLPVQQARDPALVYAANERYLEAA
jgi:DNA repair protein RadD